MAAQRCNDTGYLDRLMEHVKSSITDIGNFYKSYQQYQHNVVFFLIQGF